MAADPASVSAVNGLRFDPVPPGLVRTSTGSIIASRVVDRWRERLVRRLWVSDLCLLVLAVFGAQQVWFGVGGAEAAITLDPRFADYSYWIISAVLVVVWMWSLSLSDSRSDRVLGGGPTEYMLVVNSSFRLFGVVAIVAFLLRIDLARGYLLISLPVGVTLLLISRWLWRRWLGRQRLRGEYSARVLLVGSLSSVRNLAKELQRVPGSGFRVVGACVPDTAALDGVVPRSSIRIVGSVDTVDRALAETGADTVAITSTDELSPAKVKQISWQLEQGRQHLILAPSITDIAGPRIHIRPVAGLPLIHVETPRFSRGQIFAKRMLDLVLSAVALLVASPVFLVLALAVRMSSPGPVLFRQTRVGYRGAEFTMVKFRSMVQDAEARLVDLRSVDRDAGNEILFKLKDDPRVTTIGRFMRRYSLDELPQLFNVLAGSMSLVGPRPPLPSEVAQYADHVHRRFLAKPGITGLWQVSGRSSLSWEDSVRLDLSYVENWTLVADLVILLKTVRAALRPGSTAY